MTTDSYLLELKPCADPYRRHGIDRDPIYRLKRLLKYAARDCGFKIDWGRRPPLDALDAETSPVIRFADGPAAEALLMLKRAPLFLRVVYNATEQRWDALDQLTDKPAATELIFVYRRQGEAAVAMIDWTERGRRVGGRFASATYSHVEPQPDDATVRATKLWQEWCWAQVKKQVEVSK